jgi:hypothetical protein
VKEGHQCFSRNLQKCSLLHKKEEITLDLGFSTLGNQRKEVLALKEGLKTRNTLNSVDFSISKV